MPQCPKACAADGCRGCTKELWAFRTAVGPFIGGGRSSLFDGDEIAPRDAGDDGSPVGGPRRAEQAGRRGMRHAARERESIPKFRLPQFSESSARARFKWTIPPKATDGDPPLISGTSPLPRSPDPYACGMRHRASRREEPQVRTVRYPQRQGDSVGMTPDPPCWTAFLRGSRQHPILCRSRSPAIRA